MSDWAALDAEVSLWRAAGRVPTIWWRDDDAQAPTAALDRLLALSDRAQAPLHLAVIPKGIDPALGPHVAGARHINLIQHGFAHLNHAAQGERASEFGPSRAENAIRRDLVDGWALLQAAGLPNLLPVFAAPWNRVGDRMPAQMSALGYRILSTSYPRSLQWPAQGVEQINIHVDPIRWKEGARFRGEPKILSDVIEHLALRRTGTVDPDEPTGINTHHLQTCERTWAFLDRFMPHLSDQGVRWICLKEHLSHA